MPIGPAEEAHISVLHKHIGSPHRDQQRWSPGRGIARGHDHALLAALGALVAGMAATAAGAGIGIRHLQKTGLAVDTAMGLSLLAGGLVLLGYAATMSWRSLHRWSRLALVPVALVVLQLVASAALAVMYAVSPHPALGTGTPGDEGLEYRDVTFTTRDGLDLSAWWIPSRNGAAVVLKHGAGSSRTATISHAGVLARHGYGVLMMDARGHGRSGGRGMDLGWHGEEDTTAAVTFLSRQGDVVPTRIGVVGLSMGGEEAIGAAGVDPRIRAVVAEGATGRTATDNDDIRAEGYATALERGLDWITYGLTDLLTGASPPASLRSSVVSSDAEFLLIAAGTVEKEALAAASLRSAAPQCVTTWTVPGAGHMQGLETAPEGWERRVVGFLDSQLQPRNVSDPHQTRPRTRATGTKGCCQLRLSCDLVRWVSQKQQMAPGNLERSGRSTLIDHVGFGEGLLVDDDVSVVADDHVFAGKADDTLDDGPSYFVGFGDDDVSPSQGSRRGDASGQDVLTGCQCGRHALGIHHGHEAEPVTCGEPETHGQHDSHGHRRLSGVDQIRAPTKTPRP